MTLSWNEIKDRAFRFSKEWEHETSEDSEAKSFWDGFFNVFGISRRRVATFERKVKKIDDKPGFIDLLWKGVILIEHKSLGKDLNKAYSQAKDYFPGLTDKELPRYILVSDFARFRLYDLDENTQVEFELKDFVGNVSHFGFIAGYKKKTYKEEDPANIEAAELMGKLHDKLKAVGYEGHELEVYLVRLLFCLFADDTNIFEKSIFVDYIEQKTNVDGSDLAHHLSTIFYILNTPEEKRLKNLDEDLKAFPYVDGKLFSENLPPASFDSNMRNALLECCRFDWSNISPAIFGSLFQSVMDPVKRRNLGAHYTSEKNILKLIKPLFLDELWEEFERNRNKRVRLQEFLQKLRTLRFFDPACGCGNFLVIAYRELRLLELEILKELYRFGDDVLHIGMITQIDVDQFYGIEIEEFPARIAEVALWLIDHQMNMLVSEAFGMYYVRLPLTKSANIINGNALRIDWNNLYGSDEKFVYADKTNVYVVSDPTENYDTLNVLTKKVEFIDDKEFSIKQSQLHPTFNYIFGNPPFVGNQLQSKQQKADMDLIFSGIKSAGVLDYVSAWYVKGARYLQNNNLNGNTKIAFVSTNSISQGEQVGILWKELFKYNVKIHFAHQTFRWDNEAREMAAVHVIILGFGLSEVQRKSIFIYEDIRKVPSVKLAKNINPYLVDANNILILRRQNPICKVPHIFKGNQPTDGGFLILNETEKLEYLLHEPGGEKFIKNLISGFEFINNIKRYCFWIVDSFGELSRLPILKKRLKQVRDFRLKSTFADTRKLADKPYQFRDLKNPESYIVIPATTSERRKYIPFGFLNSDYIPSNSVYIIPNADTYHFGVLSSEMHISWVKYTCGRLKSDFRYSKDIVYNNFPWPLEPDENYVEKVKETAQNILDVRAKYPDSSLAVLYDPLTMPPDLLKAHNENDRAVDQCYRSQPFLSESSRIEYLFDLYGKYTEGLFKEPKKAKRQKTVKNL